MPDDEARPPTMNRRGNVQPGGRYGSARDDKRHVEPEVPPRGIDDAELRVPETLPGDLPENRDEAASSEDEEAA